MDDNKLIQQKMHEIMLALRAEDGQLDPPIAIPALLYTVGFILRATKPENESLETLLAHCVSDILLAMTTTERVFSEHEATRLAASVIDRAKGGTP